MRRNPNYAHDVYTVKPLPLWLDQNWPLLGYWPRTSREATPGFIFMVVNAAGQPLVIQTNGMVYHLANDPYVQARLTTEQEVLSALIPAPKGAEAKLGDTAFALSSSIVFSGPRWQVSRALQAAWSEHPKEVLVVLANRQVRTAFMSFNEIAARERLLQYAFAIGGPEAYTRLREKLDAQSHNRFNFAKVVFARNCVRRAASSALAPAAVLQP